MIDENGSQVGIMPLKEALEYSQEKGLDLIEVSPAADPPVCRVMDYGKYKYELGKKDREAHRKQKMTEIKGIRMRPKTDEHDFQFKLRNTIKFLQAGNKVNVNVIFRSREFSHPEFAKESLDRMASLVIEAGVGKVDKPASMEGKSMTMILAPISDS